MNATRIVMLPDDRGLIIGKVIGDQGLAPLKPRMVYEISNTLDVIVIEKMVSMH